MTGDQSTTTTAAPGQNYLSLARNAFDTSTTYFDSSIRPQIEAAIRQFQGVHPQGSKYHSDTYKHRSRLFRPKTRAMVRKNEAVGAEAFFSTKDVVSVKSTDDSNPNRQASAVINQSLLQYRLKKSIPWFLICMGAYQDAQTVGACVSYQDWKYDPVRKIDKPCVELIPLENLRIDPGSNWTDPINTSPYVIHMLPMYVKDVKGKMTRPDPKTGAPKWIPASNEQIIAAAKSYSDSTRLTRERGRTDPKDQAQIINEFTVVWVHRNIMEIDGIDMVWYTLGTLHMLTDPVPIDQVYFHGRRPYVMGYSMIETHKNYPDGPVGVTKDVQAEINEVTNQRVDNVKFAMNKRYFFKRGAQVDLRSLMRNVPGSATGMNDIEKDVKVIDTPDVTSSSYQEQDRLNLDFDDVSGAFSPSSIQANRKLNETVGGMTMLNSNSSQVGNYQLRTFSETWVEPVLEQLILLEQHYETDDVILTLAGKQAGLYEKFGIDTLTDEILMQELTVEVNVGIGATNPQDQVNNFLAAMKALREILADGFLENYGLDVAEVIKELFGKMGYKDGERFFNMEQDPALTAAQSMISKLQQELAQKVSPEMVAKQIEKLDAEIENLATKNKDIVASSFEKNMRAIFSTGQAAQMIAAVPALAPLMDLLAQAAGYQAPNPAGMDPNFPQPGAAAAGLTQNSVKDPRTGIEFTPGGDTSPNTPANPASPADGANQGIETMEADSA